MVKLKGVFAFYFTCKVEYPLHVGISQVLFWILLLISHEDILKCPNIYDYLGWNTIIILLIINYEFLPLNVPDSRKINLYKIQHGCTIAQNYTSYIYNNKIRMYICNIDIYFL